MYKGAADRPRDHLSIDDYNRLADNILGFAKKAIEEDGVLLPVAATVAVDGEVVRLQRMEPISREVDTPELVEELISALRTLVREKRVRAVAWCVDGRVTLPDTTTKSDALVLFCESEDHEALVFVTPYESAPGPGTSFAAGYAQRIAPQVFAVAP